MEVCGLLVREGNRLSLVPVVNSARRLGSFTVTPRRYADALAAKQLHDRDVIGMYHSHPASPPEPGSGDIAGAYEGSHMLIYACLRRKTKLWRIRKGEAKRVRFVLG